MSDPATVAPAATAAPAATTSPEPNDHVPHRRVINVNIDAKVLGIIALTLCLGVFFGLDNVETIGDNFGLRGVALTDPANNWVMSSFNIEVVYPIVLILAIFVLALIFKRIER